MRRPVLSTLSAFVAVGGTQSEVAIQFVADSIERAISGGAVADQLDSARSFGRFRGTAVLNCRGLTTRTSHVTPSMTASAV